MTDIARYSQKYNQGGTGKKAWVREGERERVVTDIARYSQKYNQGGYREEGMGERRREGRG